MPVHWQSWHVQKRPSRCLAWVRDARDMSRQLLAEVVNQGMRLFVVQAELRRSGFEDLIAAGIVLTGGTSKMEGVCELAEEIFICRFELAHQQVLKD